jgi:hypothetical protein
LGRRTKTAFVTTIAHQLAQLRRDWRKAIAAAIKSDTIIFKKGLDDQMETLILAPLRKVARARRSRARIRGVIVVDSLDECGIEEVHDTTTGATRKNEQDQLEILQVLHQAASDPTFPFRILIASRPERVFREFFDQENHLASFAQKLDLHEDYNADADITLFLNTHLSRIRRRYNLPSSWPPSGVVKTLVMNASGQFIYAATVIRDLDAVDREPPNALLEAILKVGVQDASKSQSSKNPLQQLDALYSHILKTSPDPPRSVQWIRAIDMLNGHLGGGYASSRNIILLLQTNPDSGDAEAEHFLGRLHSLIRIPPPHHQVTTEYRFYHKSLLDFLKDPSRCRGSLYIEQQEIGTFIGDRFVRACASEYYIFPICSFFPSNTIL